VVSFLRGFELFGFLIHMLEQIVADMVPFFVIFVVITVGAPPPSPPPPRAFMRPGVL
jgi:hypothetical protein